MYDLSSPDVLVWTSETQKGDLVDDATSRRMMERMMKLITHERRKKEDARCPKRTNWKYLYGNGLSQSQPHFDDPE
jgi:hypothetical protein